MRIQVRIQIRGMLIEERRSLVGPCLRLRSNGIGRISLYILRNLMFIIGNYAISKTYFFPIIMV